LLDILPSLLLDEVSQEVTLNQEVERPGVGGFFYSSELHCRIVKRKERERIAPEQAIIYAQVAISDLMDRKIDRLRDPAKSDETVARLGLPPQSVQNCNHHEIGPWRTLEQLGDIVYRPLFRWF
jgi:hypothetical protein